MVDPTPPRSTNRLSLLQRVIFDIPKLLKAHGPQLTEMGRQSLWSVNQSFAVDAEKRVAIIKVADRNRNYSVHFVWDNDPAEGEPLTDTYCNCQISNNYDLCRHTWAAVSVIQRHLQTLNSAIAKAITQSDPNAWMQALTPLDRFLDETHLPEVDGTNASAADADVRRLHYRVEVEQGRIAVNVYEQAILKNGSWGKGRKMVWSRLANDPPANLGPVDQHILSLTQKIHGAQEARSYYSYGSYNPYRSPSIWELLKILTGHPLVFHSGDLEHPLEIKREEMEIVLKTQSDGRLAIQPSLGGSPLSSSPAVQFEPEVGVIFPQWEQNRLLYWKGEPAAVKLVQQLHQQAVAIPPTGLPDLLERLTRIERSFKVVYPEEMEGQTTPADSRIHLRLVPRVADGGLAVEIWARPVSGGTYFEPGAGTATIARYEDAARLAVERDLEAERVHAAECQQALRLDRFYTHRPWRWMVDGGDATLDFLAEVQGHQDASWVVEWSNSAVPRPEVVGELKPSNLKLEIGNDHDWFGVEGTIDIDGEKVPLMTVLNALKSNSRYVQLKGGKWALIAAEFRDRLATLDDLLHRHQSKFNIDITAAPLLEDLFKDQQITIKAAKEWRAALQKLELARHHNPQVPKEFKAELRDYQLDGFRWLSRLAAWGVGGCLADDMGLGKTVQALAVLVERQKVGPTLVIAPVSVGFNWVNETRKFAPSLKPHLYRDTERGEFLDSVGPGDLVVASYGLLLRDAEYFTKVRWGTLILDEAQFIKNSRTKSAQAVREINADWRLSLTGTPVENQLGDLWSLFRASSPGLFGSWERFRERFADPIEKQKLPERQQALARTVRPFILRRTKDEVLKELPPRTEMILSAVLSPAERKLYEDARLFALTQLAGIDTGKNESRFQVLAMLTRLRQLACHPGLVDDQWKNSSAKLDVLLETVDEIREGNHRALIFSQFTTHLEIIRKALDERNVSYLYLDGQTPEKQRRERVEAFQNGQGDFFLISLKAGGTGLNLTGADYVIHMDPWWNPAVEDQATDRAHRIGQQKAVMVYRLVAEETIEEKILALHEKKRNLVAGIMEGSDQAGKLSTEDLIDLIKSSHTPEMPAKEAKSRTAKSRVKPKAKNM